MGPARAGSPVLKPETIDAWDRYIEVVSEKTRQCETPGPRFLSLDESSARQVRQGEVQVAPAGPQIPRKVPSGLIHDWVGAVFVPGATLEKTLALVEDYNHHKDVYKPEVIESKLIARNGNDFKIELRLLKKKVITVVLFSLHQICMLHPPPVVPSNLPVEALHEEVA